MVDFYKEENRRIIFFICILWLISSLIMLRQLLSAGYFSCLTEDTWAFTSWAAEFTESVKNGIAYPRWTSLSFWGYGSPTFILYSPLAFYLTAFFSIFTGSVITAMNFVKFTALFLAGIGMFFLAKEFYSEKAAFLSASFYMLFPYNIFGLYFSWTFATTVAIIWFSPILLFMYRYIKERNILNILYAGACFGGLILTHLISAYMFVFIMAGFVLFMSFVKKDLKICVALPLIILVGSLLSAVYLLPMLYEKKLLNLGAFINSTYFHYSDYFILPDLTAKRSAQQFWRVYYNEFVFNVMLLCIFTILFAYQVIRLKKGKNNENSTAVNTYFLLAAIMTIFLLFGASAFFWKTIPFIKFIQFPPRWMPVTSFLVAFLSAANMQKIHQNYPINKEWYVNVVMIFLVFLLCILPSLKYITLAPVFNEQELLPAKSVYWTLEHLPANINSEGIGKYNDDLQRVIILKGSGKTVIADWKSEKRIIKTTATNLMSLRIRTFFFPGWSASIDGKQTEIIKEKGSGAILIDVPPGDHVLELKFVDTPIRYYSKFVSIFSLLTITTLILIIRLRYRGNYIHET